MSPEEPFSPINPRHYRSHPSGVECITITRHMNFNLGNAIKYIWRAQGKVEDLQKALWYINDEIKRLQCASPTPPSTTASADSTKSVPISVLPSNRLSYPNTS